MAFDPAALDALAHTERGFTDWRYETPDPYEELLAPYYFNEAGPKFRAGDSIKFTASDAHGGIIVLEVGTRVGNREPYVRVIGTVIVQG